MFYFRLDFSVVSTKTNNLVTSLRLKATEVDITIYGSNDVGLFIRTSHLNTGFRPSTLFDFSAWINYIRTFFCYTPPPNVRFYDDCEKYEIELLKETIGDVNVLYVSRQLTDVMSREVLKQFNAPRELFLNRNPFEDICQIQQIFIQNYKRIVFDDVHSLEDMLLVNSEKAELSHPTTQKQFNQFLKHWIRGSNPRLQRMDLLIDSNDFVNGEVYLNGIRCMEMSEETKRGIREKHELLEGGMVEIRRKDGTPAVIATYDGHRGLNIYLIVLA
ncbi:hypothetical protein CRE_23085 [Caenorhabditis remanei]|uniref:Sdz-33 F-box domain-containing protein n=1 Tax=Caenorhabditis remanei TaxID=31234 RepID=E3N9E9_CAERE|nr:hypothetical protein CRE_23085 [Caenorhabditis remanei]